MALGLKPTQLEKTELVTRHFVESSQILEKTLESCVDEILEAADIITDCFRRGNRLLICGNGGSAAESQHMAAELTHRLSSAVVRRALPAIALTTDTSFLTACANDHGFDHVFARQVEALGQPGDVLLTEAGVELLTEAAASVLPFANGQAGVDPQICLRWSDDGGLGYRF